MKIRSIRTRRRAMLALLSMALAMPVTAWGQLNIWAPPAPPAPDPNDKSRAVHATGQPARWITDADYPDDAMRENRQGIVQFRIAVAPDGKPAACEILASSGHRDLDYNTCRLLFERARFAPALDRSGTPTTGFYTNRIRWSIPPATEAYPRGPIEAGFLRLDRPLATPLFGTKEAGTLSGRVRLSLRIARDGSIARCTVIDGTAPKKLVDESCPRVLRTVKFDPALDVDGQPTEGRYDTTLVWDDAAYMESMVVNPVQFFPPIGQLRQSFIVGKDGIVRGCQAERSGVIPFGLVTADPCRISFHGEPYRDADGNAVERRVSIDFGVTVDPN